MISDVLSDAEDEIRRYLSDPDFSDCYGDPEFREWVEAVLKEMDDLRVFLDTHPGLSELRCARRAP